MCSTMKLSLRRNRGDYLRANLAVCEREKTVNEAVMASAATAPFAKKQAFTRYSAAMMGIHNIRRELKLLRSA